MENPSETVELPVAELMNFVKKVYEVIDLVVEMDLDVPVMAALLDLRDAATTLEGAM